MDIQWEDEPFKGTQKYPQMLKAIKKAQLEDPEARKRWAYLNDFASEATARDLAYRLGTKHDEFDFISRKDGETTNVYCRLKEGVKT